MCLCVCMCTQAHICIREIIYMKIHVDTCTFFLVFPFPYLECPSLIVQNPQPIFLMWYSRQGKKGDAELNFEKIGLLMLSSSVAIRGQGKLKSLWVQHSLSLNQLWP